MKKSNGFTLVEMLSVLIIMVALALLIVPTVGKYINQSKTTTFNAQINMILNSTQNWFTETSVNGTQINTNTKYLPANGKGTLPATGTIADMTTLEQAPNNRVIKLSISFLQSIGAISSNLVDPKTNKDIGTETQYSVEIDFCGENTWAYKVLDNTTVIDKTRDCTGTALLTHAAQQYLDANKKTLKADGTKNYVTVSTLETAQYIDTNLYSGSIFIYKKNMVWYYNYDSIDTALE